MSKLARFGPAMLGDLSETKALGVRAGDEHRYTTVWVVVVTRRVFVRTWNDAPTGWFRAFRTEPHGAMRLGTREVPVAARLVRGAALQRAVTRAYAAKYDSAGARKWVHGFAERGRERNTMEIVPASPARGGTSGPRPPAPRREAR